MAAVADDIKQFTELFTFYQWALKIQEPTVIFNFVSLRKQSEQVAKTNTEIGNTHSSYTSPRLGVIDNQFQFN